VGDLTGKIDMIWLLMDPPWKEEFPSIRVPMDEVAVPRSLFAAILERIDQLHAIARTGSATREAGRGAAAANAMGTIRPEGPTPSRRRV
jgi:hypothetical protein